MSGKSRELGNGGIGNTAQRKGSQGDGGWSRTGGKILVHRLGKLVSSHGSVPVPAKECVLRAGNAHIPLRTNSHRRQDLGDVFVALRSFIN